MNETMPEQRGATAMRHPSDTALDVSPNWLQARQFLDALDQNGTFTFQTFPEAEGSQTRPRVLHGTFKEYGGELNQLNRAGAGIFVMVNAGDGVIRTGARTCRTSGNVQRIRALFVDLDAAPIAPVLNSARPPDWIVRSSPGRWHAYWRVNDCPLDRFALVQIELAARFAGDPSVKDLPRVMRLPGFLHCKTQPFCSELWLPSDYEDILRSNHE